jgi:pyruvate,orthophosphate dikinase
VTSKCSPEGIVEMANTSKKRIYFFGRKQTEGTKDMKQLLGGKGANLAEMTSIGLPVPPGFTITTESCAEYNDVGSKLLDVLMDEVHQNMSMLEQETGKRFGSEDDPLLVSVRSGAAVSMPGMMDTVLNLGLTDTAMEGLSQRSSNRRFALDAYRRLINMFGDVVMGVAHEKFEAEFDRIKAKYGISLDTDLDEQGLRALVTAYKRVYEAQTGEAFPQDPFLQLKKSIEAVFKSWSIPRAVTYRQIYEITGLLGTAVNVQTMVFGNMGQDSGTGVAFTRDPALGRNEFYGEFLVNAQGEDVVAGIRTPRPVKEMKRWRPDLYEQLLEVKTLLESHYREMQDLEFTIERGKLYILQTRTGKRTASAALKIAVDMVKEALIDHKTAVLRVPPGDLNQLLLPTFDAKAKRDVLARGLPASPGAASGTLAFRAEEAVQRAAEGEQVLLVRKETSPEDIAGIHMAAGILTSTGGMTSHAAVVARGWGKCCVVGAGEIDIDEKKRIIMVNGRRFTQLDVLSIDGSTGEVMAGDIPTQVPSLSGDFTTLMKWADEFRRLGIRTNTDTPEDAGRARSFGAEGIGLCRTEHMFFDEHRITIVREMILSEKEADRRAALEGLLPYQRADFEGIFTAMKGWPVTVRLLDPPLHEFLPQDAKAQSEVAHALGVSAARIKSRVAQLRETNPMLGHRGCRLLVTFPEILEMQVRAITEAAISCKKKRMDARPEIMIPLVGMVKELALLREKVLTIIAKVKKAQKYGGKLDIPVGTMIEVPRAALTADQVAQYADFFSFGTNDLTQMTFGFSRDDVNTFLPDYIEKQLLERDPFQSLDLEGVGQLVRMGVEKGRGAKPSLKIGICGEHGGDPLSIAFCEAVGLDYVSCSPFRVPVARLAAAQAAIK